ncbi:amidase family protein [Pontibacter sp. E15-1]|uniref:amidase family protein n=1 Tax=Pontibacter sp. E15-1 TaxID=2919918 RepID=UPI001F4FBDE0|nr:amidase family protein [Pontibacter sp. E15-1]MCJ8165910.1 amidase family protein [Pontibacter sp. E15-1]
MRAKHIPLTLFLLFTLLISGCVQQPSSTAAKKKKPFDVEEATIAEIHQALQEGACSCEKLVTTYLNRIKSYDKPTKLNAIIVTNPEALSIARQLDQEYAQTGKLRNLHCIPVVVKDNYNTKGLQTTAGSLAMKGFAPSSDAYQVKALKEAGAIVLAKSNMAEWAFSPMVTISSIAGETLNPYNLAHVPAGSSGGTAAAVAANFGTVGLGTDTGNSVRGPSAHNALVGFRTTLGLTSRSGIAPLYLRNDVGGPMARTVEDATKVLEATAGYDPADPLTAQSRGHVPDTYTQYLKRDGLKGARIGVLRTLSEKDPDPQVKALFEQAIADLRRLGAVVVDSVEVADFDNLRQNQWCSVFRHDINQYLFALGDSVPVTSLEEIIASGKYAPYIEENLKHHMAQEQHEDMTTHTCGDAYSDPRRIAFREAVEAAMDANKVEALIYPTWNNPPARVGDLKGYKGDNSQIIAPHTGQPAFTVPMGYTYDNLPAGLQFLGRIFDEPTLIRLTYAYEQGTKHRKPPVRFSSKNR